MDGGDVGELAAPFGVFYAEEGGQEGGWREVVVDDFDDSLGWRGRVRDGQEADCLF